MLTDFLIFWQWWLEAIETTRFFHWPFTFVLKCISKSILIKLGHPKKYLPKFPTQKNPGIENFKPPKHPWIITVTWNSEYQLGIERQDIREGNICQWSKTNWLPWSRHSLERTMQAKRITRLTLLIPEWESWRHTEIQCTRKCTVLVFCTSGSQVHSFQHPKHQPGYGIEDPSILHGPETMKIHSV